MRIVGTERLIAGMNGIGRDIRARLGEAGFKGAQRIVNIATKKLRGEVLNVRSGTLIKSLRAYKIDRDSAMAAVIGPAAKYGAAHEVGATIPAHRVAPKYKKALHWVGGGTDFFSKGHTIPTFDLPKRPWFYPSGEQAAPEIVEDFRRILEDAVRANSDHGREAAGG